MSKKSWFQKINRYYPEDNTHSVFATFSENTFISSLPLIESNDNYALVVLRNDQINRYWAFLDGNGNILAKKSSLTHMAIIL